MPAGAEKILEIIKGRRSIRRFKKETPTDLEVNKVLEAARWAPSGLNNQPWRFLIIKDQKKKDGLCEFTKYGGIIKAAPLAIAVYLSLTDSYHRDKDLMAIGSCIQNMLLEAHAIGLGACWLGEILSRKEEVSRYLNFNNDLELTAIIALGYPNESIIKSSRKPLEDLRSWA